MPSLSKIIKKINQAKAAINSVKGIKSKLESINWESVADADELKEQAEKARRLLSDRKASLEKSLDPNNAKKRKSKKSPPGGYIELEYPLHDKLENYIVFTTRPRIGRPTGNKGSNLLNETNEQLEIYLYVPDDLNSTAMVSYEQGEVGLMTRGMVEAFQQENFIQGLSKGLDAVVAAGSKMFTDMLNGLSGNNMYFLQGKAKNPMAEQMLKGVDFRTFAFTYIFVPKSPEEAEMVNKIIYGFRSAMLPDTYAPLGGGALDAEAFFNYPNKFEVEFDGPIADKVDGFLPCVLTKCDVNHTGGLKFSTYRDGQPIKTQMSLEFTEIRIMTQENYQHISPLGDKSIEKTTSISDKLSEDRKFATDQANMAAAAEKAYIQRQKNLEAQQNNGDNG